MEVKCYCPECNTMMIMGEKCPRENDHARMKKVKLERKRQEKEGNERHKDKSFMWKTLNSPFIG